MDAVKYALGDVVYHLTEPEKPGVIVHITFYPGGHYYTVQWNQQDRGSHYEIELTSEKRFSDVVT